MHSNVERWDSRCLVDIWRSHAHGAMAKKSIGLECHCGYLAYPDGMSQSVANVSVFIALARMYVIMA